MRRLLALAALVLAGSVGNAQATTITFEDHAVAFGTATPLIGDLTSGGFLFDMASNVYQFANNSANVDDGSTYLVTQGDPLSQTTFSQIGGAPFALTSLDYAEWQSDIPGSHASRADHSDWQPGRRRHRVRHALPGRHLRWARRSTGFPDVRLWSAVDESGERGSVRDWSDIRQPQLLRDR